MSHLAALHWPSNVDLASLFSRELVGRRRDAVDPKVAPELSLVDNDLISQMPNEKARIGNPYRKPSRGESAMRRKNPARREFLKAAIAGAGLATLPAILSSLPRVVADSEENSPGYHFVVVSKTSTTPPDLVALEGDGHVTHSKATGGGVFTHFVPTGSPPFPIRGAGTWKPERVVNFGLIGTYGTLAAGILEMDVELVREIPSRAVIPAHMEVVCNLGPANLANDGLEEGVYVDVAVAGLSFAPFGTGVTVFTPADEE